MVNFYLFFIQELVPPSRSTLELAQVKEFYSKFAVDNLLSIQGQKPKGWSDCIGLELENKKLSLFI